MQSLLTSCWLSPLGQLAACLPHSTPTLGMGVRVWAEPEGKLRLEWGQPPLPLASLGRSGEQALGPRPRIRAGSHSRPHGTPSAPSVLSADPLVLLGGQSGSWKSLGASRLREGTGLPRARGTPAGSDWQQSPRPCQNRASPSAAQPQGQARIPVLSPCCAPWGPLAWEWALRPLLVSSVSPRGTVPPSPGRCARAGVR